MYYYWFIIKPAVGINPHTIVDSLIPISLNIEQLSDGSFSFLFNTDTPISIEAWKKSFPWRLFGWVNEGMFYPANLGYTQTLDGLNRFVSTYGLTYANKRLLPLSA